MLRCRAAEPPPLFSGSFIAFPPPRDCGGEQGALGRCQARLPPKGALQNSPEFGSSLLRLRSRALDLGGGGLDERPWSGLYLAQGRHNSEGRPLLPTSFWKKARSPPLCRLVASLSRAVEQGRGARGGVWRSLGVEENIL